MAFLIGGANSAAADAGYDVDNSLRFNDDDGAYLQRTAGANTGEDNATLSFWFKLGNIKSDNNGGHIMTEGGTTGYTIMQIYAQKIYIGSSAFGTMFPNLIRDPSAWYHLFVAFDSSQATDTNRVKAYLNGVLLTDAVTFTDYPDQNENLALCEDGDTTRVGSRGNSGAEAFDGYLAEFHFLDGTTKAYTDFGEFDEDSGIWKPKEYTDGSYGNNGFFLEFKETGTNQDSSGIGADTSGEDNHFAVTNLAATDQATDTPTNNFATLNPLDIGSEATLSEGNCKYTGGTTVGQGQRQVCGGTFGVSKGKWYYEVKKISSWHAVPGIYAADHAGARIGYDSPFASPWDNLMHGCYTSTGDAYNGSTYSAYGSGIDDDDIIGVALDLDNGAIYYSDNGTFMDSGDPTSGASKTGAAPNFTTTVETWILPFIADGSSGWAGVYEFNLGGCPAFTVSSGNSDANGYGNFEYAVPSGYYAPCTKNLAEFG